MWGGVETVGTPEGSVDMTPAVLVITRASALTVHLLDHVLQVSSVVLSQLQNQTNLNKLRSTSSRLLCR